MYRTIVEEHAFVQDLDSLAKDYPRIYDVKDAVSWELSKRPLAGTAVFGYHQWRLYNTFQVGITPVFTILYSYDEQKDPNTVRLFGVRAADKVRDE